LRIEAVFTNGPKRTHFSYEDWLPSRLVPLTLLGYIIAAAAVAGKAQQRYKVGVVNVS
jgi:hypothetical protein